MFISLILSLAVLGVVFVRAAIIEYRLHRDRRWKRSGLKENLISAFGWAYFKQPKGKHRARRRPVAHRLCKEWQSCAYRYREFEGRRASYYIKRARAEAKYRAGVTAGLHGYSTDSSFPGLSTPEGSSTSFTATSTSIPIWPTSEDRKSA